MDVLVLHNRTAGDEELSSGRLLALLRREGYNPRYYDLHAALEEPEKLPDTERIVVAGGDGSFRQVALKLAARKTPIALLPLGTANNVARSLGIEGSPAEVIASWDRYEPRRFDLGVARGPWGERHFVEGVGVGLFGRLIGILGRMAESEAHESAARPHRVASDLRSTAVLAHELAPIAVQASLDGEMLAGDILLLECLNIGRVGASFEAAPDADVSDGRFDVVIATLQDRPKLQESLSNALRETPLPSLLPVRQVQRLELTVPRCDFRIDDEVTPVGDGTRIEVMMASQSLEVLTPVEKE